MSTLEQTANSIAKEVFESIDSIYIDPKGQFIDVKGTYKHPIYGNESHRNLRVWNPMEENGEQVSLASVTPHMGGERTPSFEFFWGEEPSRIAKVLNSRLGYVSWGS